MDEDDKKGENISQLVNLMQNQEAHQPGPRGRCGPRGGHHRGRGGCGPKMGRGRGGMFGHGERPRTSCGQGNKFERYEQMFDNFMNQVISQKCGEGQD